HHPRPLAPPSTARRPSGPPLRGPSLRPLRRGRRLRHSGHSSRPLGEHPPCHLRGSRLPRPPPHRRIPTHPPHPTQSHPLTSLSHSPRPSRSGPTRRYPGACPLDTSTRRVSRLRRTGLHRGHPRGPLSDPNLRDTEFRPNPFFLAG